MIQGINDVGNVFAQVAVGVVRLLEQFRCLVYQVGGEDVVKQAVFISLVELVQSIGEQTEGSADKDLACFALFQLRSNFQNAVSGRNHIVNDDHVLSFHVSTQEFMGNDGVAAIDDPGVVAAFVEHTHIQPQDVCHVDGTAHAAFIRADHHHIVFVNREGPAQNVNSPLINW